MEQDKTIRKPKQTRSIKTKEKILDTAYQLFCKKGYYKTTTNEIAKVAGVSIGSLYSYFKDKDTIFMEILGRYNESFAKVQSELTQNMDVYRTDKKAWLREFIKSMIAVHEISKELNHEMKFLCYTKPEVAAVMDEQHEKSWQKVVYYFSLFKDDMKVKDIEAAAIVTFNLINSTVDQIVFCDNKIDNERILQAGIDAVYKFLMGQKVKSDLFNPIDQSDPAKHKTGFKNFRYEFFFVLYELINLIYFFLRIFAFYSLVRVS